MYFPSHSYQYVYIYILYCSMYFPSHIRVCPKELGRNWGDGGKCWCVVCHVCVLPAVCVMPVVCVLPAVCVMPVVCVLLGVCVMPVPCLQADNVRVRHNRVCVRAESPVMDSRIRIIAYSTTP